MASYVVVPHDLAREDDPARQDDDDEHIIAIVVGVQRAMVHQAPRGVHQLRARR